MEIFKLKGGKAAGICEVPAELLKAGGEPMARGLHAVLAAIWQSGSIPPDLLRGVVIPLWNGKGDHWVCSNYFGITLITVDHILAPRVIVEHRHEFSHGLLAAYIDLKKVFDSVHRKSLWEILRLRGIPTQLIGLICGATLGNIKVTDLDLVDYIAILSESLESLVAALDAFSNEAKPLGLEVLDQDQNPGFWGCAIKQGSQLTDWPGSRGHDLGQQEYLEVLVPMQKD
ncbi:uncharacterized protein [Penaeus vannamei]|uniref:uncharacterized protein n=1 Tax=Penaeus vannamei TaxID=6689 RepID=UPI00387FAEBD